MGLKRLVDHATDRLVRTGLANTSGLRATHTATGYVRYLWLAGAGASFGIDCAKWSRLPDTPLWLTLWGPEHGREGAKPVRETLRNLESFRQRDPPDLFDQGEILVMPLDMPIGVEEDALLNAIVRRLEHIARLIGPP